MDVVSFIPLVIQVLYFCFVILFVFFGLCSVYILLNYGEKLKVSFIASVLFIVLFLILIGFSYHSLSIVLTSLET